MAFKIHLIKYGCVSVSLDLSTYKNIFWDFDGVIKETIEIKSNAFYSIFLKYGVDIAEKVKLHHSRNGGLSRFEKIPMYLKLANQKPNKNLVKKHLDAFSELVLDLVKHSKWVPGVEKIIRENKYKQNFFLISATPQDELVNIVNHLGLKNNFDEIFGAPINKNKAIKSIMVKLNLNKNECLMIGDALEDLEAACDNDINFLLRLHCHNKNLFDNFTGAYIKDFS